MNRGRLKTTDLPIRVDEISSSASQQTIGGEPETALTVLERSQNTSGRQFAVGRAALRKETERTIAHVDDESDGVSIDPATRHTHIMQYGTWIAVDGGWAIVSDEWIAGVLAQQITGHLSDVDLDLQGLLADIDGPDVWQLGFAGRGVAKGGTKGTLFGSHVDEDPDLGDELMHTPLNELGIEHVYQTRPVKAYFAASTGYVEVYGDWTSRQFVDYVGDHVVRHVRGEDGETSESTEVEDAVDESQETFDELDSVTVTDGGEE